MKNKRKSHRKGMTLEEEYGVERAKEIRNKLSKSHIGLISGMKNKHHTEESKKKMREGHEGKTSYKKNKTYEEIYGIEKAKEIKEKLSRAKKGKRISPQTEFKKGMSLSEKTKEKISKNNARYWLGKKRPKEDIKKILTRRTPSSLEEKFQNIVNKYKLPYKFVGNGSFIIENYNPDFININGKKIAIEVYAKYYKLRNHKTIEQWKEKRSKVFGKYGWKIIYFDETEVNEKYILAKLGGE